MRLVKDINGVEIDLSFPHKQQCPNCAKNGNDTREDNLQVYGLDENDYHKGAHCFACGWTFPKQEWIEENEYNKINLEDIVGLDFNSDIHENIIKKNTTTDVDGFRGIDQAISRKFGVRYEVANGEVKKVYYPTTIKNDLTGYKIRGVPKLFQTPYGETGLDCQLFGQFLFPTHNNICLIVGGEHDVLAAFQMLYKAQKDKSFNATAVVSGTCGEPSIHKQVQRQYAWFNQFKKIIICMDNDKAGDEAKDELVKVLPRNKVYIMKLRTGKEYKDPNEYLKNGKQQEFVNDFWGATQYMPSGVHGSSSAVNDMQSVELKRISLPYSFTKLAEALGGDMEEAELITSSSGEKYWKGIGYPTDAVHLIAARTSVGKTTTIGKLVRHWLRNEKDLKIGIMSLEDEYKRYYLKLFSGELKVNLMNMGNKKRNEFLNQEWVQKKINELTLDENGGNNFYVFDDNGCNLEETKERILEMVIQLGINTLIIDPLIVLFSGTSREEQEQFCKWLIDVKKQYGLTLFIVAHIVKTETGKDGKKRVPNEDDIKGVSDLASVVSTTVILDRDKSADEEIDRNTTSVYMPKNREGSITGSILKLLYDIETHDLQDKDVWEELKLDENIKKNSKAQAI